ncbi:MAG: ribonuclease R [Candidatus Thiodiazotropha sp. (ex Lucinoma aequizonata)]|nr:ribonuclease R [Candidatus Thiodiazotropha sp. (ex Lucinoma aequizonata)]MCU7888787.1 ribonuclease R [Candidatus Thiodiazotropha sp. (ex Lucinoma aequizonata)]MCU7894450.1 ribonuclease R [Candidatus Thiodiazotropha sp. (ex Lucinoma aequizonata)]MCU7900255.1 ribonuclease R [Candidatus Thiodiazotropha sp. (ex Lucinoma aequizonata)]MCU7901907.1 ribonuclease R [Candidatus Thiodiazotropha sp. (ex Lucinoma aequizonata)]
MAKNKSRRSTGKDPHQAREARKYQNPIPSREYIMETLESEGMPMDMQALAKRLDLTSEEQLEALRRRLRAMERDGQLICNRNDNYCLVNKRDLIVGRVIGHADGFGFLRPDDSGDDLYLSFKEMRLVFHDDRAVVRVTGVDRRNRLEGGIVEVLERNTRTMAGRLYMEAGVGFVAPDSKRLSKDVIIPSSEIGNAKQGQMVVAEILDQPTKRTPPIGRITEVLGDHMGPGMETDIAIRTHSIPIEWPDEVEQQISGLKPEVANADKKDRVDLRHLPLVTIDGADARDFDDAVYCEPKPKGWRLLVCIADVSHYVEPGDALDKEAQIRGNSVYFPDRVVPMLPEVLSNGLCSINPQVDRLCMTCELYIDKSGKVIRSKFFPAVMQSHARLIYNDVAAMLEGDSTLCKKYANLLPHLHDLYQLYQVLHAQRVERGAIDFDTTETRIEFNDLKRVERIVPVIRNDAHRLIEECMLAANVATARFLLRKNQPVLYRIHEGPAEEKLTDLRGFLGELSLSLPGTKKPTAGDYSVLLKQIKERPDRHLIQVVLLRSLSQALYSSENVGHFGLSYQAYTHFTSPIRRFPDLIVHRAIKHAINQGNADDFDYTKPDLQGLGEHCSSTEQKADEATRDALDWLKCEYMQDKVGETFNGIITSVNSFGVFVELEEIYVDGLVHITALDNDYYHYDPVGHRLTGERTGKVLRLGDPLTIIVAKVDLDDRKIDFVPAKTAGGGTANKKRSRSSKKSDRSSKPVADKAPSRKKRPGKKPRPSPKKP